jgi:hypothetical protein
VEEVGLRVEVALAGVPLLDVAVKVDHLLRA